MHSPKACVPNMADDALRFAAAGEALSRARQWRTRRGQVAIAMVRAYVKLARQLVALPHGAAPRSVP